MTRKKKSMIGLDPLAWLDEEKETEKENPLPQDSTSTADRVTETQPVTNSSESGAALSDNKKKNQRGVTNQKNTSMNSSVKRIIVLGHQIEEAALLKGYKLLAGNLDEIVTEFYAQLFAQHPDVKPLFDNASDKEQANKLASTLTLLVENLHNENALITALSIMGEAHQGYGALPEHYPVVAELLVSSFKQNVGRAWTKAISTAWMELLVAAAETMCAAYKEEDVVTKNETATAVVSDEHILLLSSTQDISKSQALKADVLTLVNDSDVIDIDASSVERIDGSALQLLCSLFIYAQHNDLEINWIKPSSALIDSVKTLGMQGVLELN